MKSKNSMVAKQTFAFKPKLLEALEENGQAESFGVALYATLCN
jgi:hypothetical protein